MNKKLTYLLPLLMLVACTENAGDEVIGLAPYTLSVDNTEIESDGKQMATFKITDANGTVLTDNEELMSKIWFKNEETGRRLKGKTKIFRSVEDGEYTFSATFSGNPCENTVTVKSKNRSHYEVFKKNVCIYRLTATWCQFCPDMTKALERVSDWTKSRIVELDLHASGSTFALSNGAKYIADGLKDNFKTGGYPSCVYDLDVVSGSCLYSDIEDLVFDRITDNPATCGIKASSTYVDGVLSLQASLTSSTGGKYDIGYALLVDGLDGGAGAYEKVYDNTVVAISGNYEYLSTAAQELEMNQEAKIVDLSQSVGLPSSAKVSDCSIAVFALKQNGNDVNIDNAVVFPLGGSVDYVRN